MKQRAVMSGLWLAIALVLATGCAKEQPPVTPSAPVGTILSVSGEVTATRAAAAAAQRVLTEKSQVWADDTVTTGVGASVRISLDHNNAVWSLGASKSKRVDKSAAWRAKKVEPLVAVASNNAKTAAAGRHSEQEAASSGEAAVRAEPSTSAPDQAGKRPAPSAETAPAAPTPPPAALDDTKPTTELPTAAKPRAVKSKPKRPRKPRRPRMAKPQDPAPRSPSTARKARLDSLLVGGGSVPGGGLRPGGGGGAGMARAKTGGGASAPSLGRDPSGRSQGLASRRSESALRSVITLTIAVKGGLERAAVQRVLRRQVRGFRRCHEHMLRTSPKLAGRVVFRLVFGKDRRVHAVKLLKVTMSSAGAGQRFAACVGQRLKRLRVPTAAEETTVIVTVLAKPAQQ